MIWNAVYVFPEGFVQLTPRGPVPIRGVAEPVDVFELSGATHARRSFGFVSQIVGLPPSVVIFSSTDVPADDCLRRFPEGTHRRTGPPLWIAV
jgi:hypothetical protein